MGQYRPLADCEVYNPDSGTWSATFPMKNPRCYHTATMLPNGKVLIAGGGSSCAELYDPAAGKWAVTGEMSDNRSRHTATLLANGTVLIAGGELNEGDYQYLSSAALYYPATETWTPTVAMSTSRSVHTATLLPNGKVLVAGGYIGRTGVGAQTAQMSAEEYDPTSETWTTTGSMHDPRAAHSATVMTDGKVLVAGGCSNDNGNGAQASADVYNPNTGTWVRVGALNAARGAHSATLLPSGEVLIAGGNNGNYLGDLYSAEVFEPTMQRWIAGPTMNDSHSLHTATLLPDGRVLVAAGFRASAEIYVPTGGLRLFAQPQDITTNVAAAVSFSVGVACDIPPSHYQWRFQSVGGALVNLPGATNSTLMIESTTAGQAGKYSCRVWNAYGAVESRAASLVMLDLVAACYPPVQVAGPTSIEKVAGKTSLVLVAHGWVAPWDKDKGVPNWETDLCDLMEDRVGGEWQVGALDWVEAASQDGPSKAFDNGRSIGGQLGKCLAGQRWAHIHMIGHSAGAALIQAAADAIKHNAPTTVVHTTFLDAFLRFDYTGREWFGTNADWADSYFAHDRLTDEMGRLMFLPSLTEGPLTNAFTVDVTTADPKCWTNVVSGMPQAESTHGWPHDFYLGSVVGTNQGCCAGFGFALSKEAGGWNNHSDLLPGRKPEVPCGPSSTEWVQLPLVAWESLWLALLPNATSTLGASLNGGSCRLNAASSQSLPRNAANGSDYGPLNAGDPPTALPAWAAVAVTVTNPVNFLQFDAAFSSTNAAEGLMTVYWNTNEIGSVDERVASPGLQKYRFLLPTIESEGIFTLSFRLDAFAGTSSSIAVTNVATGFVGLTNPITLRMVAPASNAPLALELTAPSGFTYLVESSTNLVDWAAAALLVNTNGTVVFPDLVVTNSSARFYRGTLY